jgi:hypothetical protein
MDLQIDLLKVPTAYKSFKAWSRRLGIPYTTVIGWKENGVPDWRTKAVAAAAVEDGKDIFAAKDEAA